MGSVDLTELVNGNSFQLSATDWSLDLEVDESYSDDTTTGSIEYTRPFEITPYFNPSNCLSLCSFPLSFSLRLSGNYKVVYVVTNNESGGSSRTTTYYGVNASAEFLIGCPDPENSNTAPLYLTRAGATGLTTDPAISTSPDGANASGTLVLDVLGNHFEVDLVCASQWAWSNNDNWTNTFTITSSAAVEFVPCPTS